MPMITFPIVGTFNKVKQRGINPEETFNMYLINENDSKTPSALINTPGYKFQLTFPDGPDVGRCIEYYQGNAYAVVDQFFYKITPTLQVIKIAELTTSSGYVEMDGNNGNQLMVVDGANGYIYNTVANTFEIITDENFIGDPISVSFLDGRFIVNTKNSNQFQLSTLNNGLVWTDSSGTVPLTQRMQTDADTIQAVAVNHRIVFLFGTRITECWNDVGNPDFPFARIDSMIYQFGTAATGSVVQGSDMLFWLARTAQGTTSVMVSQGGMPKIVSTTDVDQEINNYDVVNDAVGYIFRENGYLFYALNFTKANASWLYNVTNDSWTKQRMKDKSRHKLSHCVSFNDLNYALAYDDGNLYELSQNYTNNNGSPIVKERITHRFFDKTLRTMKIPYAEIDCLHGFAAPSGTNADPFIELSFSKDAGVTYGKTMRAPIGRIGNRIRRTSWQKLGVSKDWVFKFVNYNDIDFYLRDMSLWVDIIGPG